MKKMILITGGAYQGQEEFYKVQLQSTDAGVNSPVLKDLHLLIRKRMQEGESYSSVLEWIEAMIPEWMENHWVILTNEVGCGVVPMERFERDWREACGRASCRIAERADEVYVVRCGIGTRLK